MEDTLEANDHEKKDTREAERTKNKTSRNGVNSNQFVDAVTSLAAVMKWLQLGNARSILMEVNIKLSIIVIA